MNDMTMRHRAIPPVRKILLVCAAYPPDIKGGGEKSTQILAQSLSALGHVVRVLTISDRPGLRLDSDGRTQVCSIRSPNIYWNFRPGATRMHKLLWHALDNFNPSAVRAVQQAITAFGPDVVVSSTIENFGPGIWLASHRCGVPVVHILRSYYVCCLRGSRYLGGHNCATPCLECRVLSAGRQRASALVQGVVGISDFILQQHASLFGAAARAVIPNGVEPGQQTARALRSDAVVTFGYLGRLEPEKGVVQILEAFSQLPAHCHLVLAGDGKPQFIAALRKRFAGERIRFLGWVSADSVYPMIDFAVVPSMWNEPFGRVVIEAFAHGIPVIAAARGGLRELVNPPHTGYLFDPDQPGALEHSCRQAAAQVAGYGAMSRRVREESGLYRPALIAQRYDAFLTEVLHG
jgi:glycosyltransferase involved in cell wall biosynthesis